jgi:hypothetical protein
LDALTAQFAKNLCGDLAQGFDLIDEPGGTRTHGPKIKSPLRTDITWPGRPSLKAKKRLQDSNNLALTLHPVYTCPAVICK